MMLVILMILMMMEVNYNNDIGGDNNCVNDYNDHHPDDWKER